MGGQRAIACVSCLVNPGQVTPGKATAGASHTSSDVNLRAKANTGKLREVHIGSQGLLSAPRLCKAYSRRAHAEKRRAPLKSCTYVY